MSITPLAMVASGDLYLARKVRRLLTLPPLLFSCLHLVDLHEKLLTWRFFSWTEKVCPCASHFVYRSINYQSISDCPCVQNMTATLFLLVSLSITVRIDRWSRLYTPYPFLLLCFLIVAPVRNPRRLEEPSLRPCGGNGGDVQPDQGSPQGAALSVLLDKRCRFCFFCSII